MIKKIFLAALGLCCLGAPAALAQNETDGDGRLVMYVRGEMTNDWSCQPEYRMTRNGDVYSISLPSLNGEFKVSSTEWNFNYGASVNESSEITDAATLTGLLDGRNFKAIGLTDVTISFTMTADSPATTLIRVSANGHEAPEPVLPPTPGNSGVSGTLPVLYINVYNADGTDFDNELIDRNLDHKNYFAGKYWLDLNGCSWLEELGAKSIGSAEEPLDLEIKARGNFTRKAFAKKPFKLKLGKKQNLLGLSKSKHFAILAHADDGYGYLRNFTGFNLGQRIGLPWTPSQQPVEVVINGDYRGLYFLTESIRVEPDRVDITALDDLAEDPALVSGGYLVELDNYDEDNQIRMDEKTCVGGYVDKLRITWDTPELYSDLQRRFVTDQFTAMNDYVGANSDVLWSYMDLDDAARYYLVEEIISHVESYHGSTYLFRDRGEGQKWHFSPLWDCGNAFNGSTEMFLYHNAPYGNTWIASLRCNEKFNQKVRDTWAWFMTSQYDGIVADIDEYVGHIAEAAKADSRRWKDAERPDYDGAQKVVDNSDMQGARDRAVWHLNAKTNWLRGQFGDYSQMGSVAEPERDTTPAAKLPEYATASISEVVADDFDFSAAEFYNLQGMRVERPAKGGVYIAVSGSRAVKLRF